MIGKVLIFSSLVVFGAFHYATSLECYSCDNTTGCKSPGKVACTNATAQQTLNYFAQHYQNVNTTTNSKNFACISNNFSTTYNQVYEWKGCTFQNSSHCSWPSRYQLKGSPQCKQCQSNLCNKSPAGRATISSMSILLAAVVALMFKNFM